MEQWGFELNPAIESHEEMSPGQLSLRESPHRHYVRKTQEITLWGTKSPRQAPLPIET